VVKFLIVLALLLAPFPQQPRPSNVSQQADIPVVDYCELLRTPDLYDKKIIRLRALYVRGFEVAAFEHPQCDEARSVWVEFDQSEPSCTDKKIRKAMQAIFNPPRKRKRGVIEIGGPERAELLAVGRFEGPRPGIPVGSQGRKIFTGHGHMNEYKYKFVVQCVEQVKAAPWPSSD
jgi:hypothetical protein